MRKRIITTLLTAALAQLLSPGQSLKEVEGAFLEPLQKRDSILIADQLRYGVTLEDVSEGTALQFQDWSKAFGDTLVVVRNWRIDTLKVFKPARKSGDPQRYRLRADLVLSPFEEGEYELPRIAVRRTLPDGTVDTLLFDPKKMDVRTIQIDTATFVINDIRGQMRYPLTFRELLPYLAAFYLLATLLILAFCLIDIHRRRSTAQEARRDPAYIVALRKLDHFRGDKYWAPEKQKSFYSGITDTLREYMAGTFGFDAKEMTTAEIFDALEGDERLAGGLYDDTKGLFELADFVKFAKHTASEEENAAALPLAVRFVTSTYQSLPSTEGEDGNEGEAV